MSVAVENLPPRESISCEAIREAAGAFDAARAAKEQRRKDVVELEQTREAAEWRDAEAAEKARAEGKPEPKRTHVAEHDKKLDAARHELKIVTISEQRACDTLEATISEHGPAWMEEVGKAVETLEAEWQNALERLTVLLSRRESARRVAEIVIGEQPGVGFARLKLKQLQDLELGAGTPSGQTGTVSVGELLASLADVGQPRPAEPRIVPGGIPFDVAQRVWGGER